MRSLQKGLICESRAHATGSCLFSAATASSLRKRCLPAKKPYNVAALLKKISAVRTVTKQCSQQMVAISHAHGSGVGRTSIQECAESCFETPNCGGQPTQGAKEPCMPESNEKQLSPHPHSSLSLWSSKAKVAVKAAVATAVLLCRSASRRQFLTQMAKHMLARYHKMVTM